MYLDFKLFWLLLFNIIKSMSQEIFTCRIACSDSIPKFVAIYKKSVKSKDLTDMLENIFSNDTNQNQRVYAKSIR